MSLAHPELFGDEVDEFRTALSRCGIWPTTVWDCDMQDQKTRRLKELIGDLNTTGSTSSVRSGALQKPSKNSVYFPEGKAAGVSIFNPAVAAWALNCFAPATGLCFDPFAGGGTRAIMAAKHGLEYFGIELRPEEVAACAERLAQCGVADRATIVQGDARNCSGILDRKADFLLTCPPYWNLEQYEGGPADLSMIADYDAFIEQLGVVVRETAKVLRHGALSCWIVGLHRDARGTLMPMHHDLARLHRAAGFALQEEIVLALRNNGAVQRVGNFDKGSRRLVRTHEYALVFRRQATA